MSFDYIDAFFISLFSLFASISLFFGTLYFGDKMVSFFRKDER